MKKQRKIPAAVKIIAITLAVLVVCAAGAWLYVFAGCQSAARVLSAPAAYTPVKFRVFGSGASSISAHFTLYDALGTEIAAVERSWNDNSLAFDFIAVRFGEDVIMFPYKIRGGNAESAALNARAMIETILAPIFLENTEVNVGACIGIALFPDDGLEPDKLVNFADMALRTASHSAPNSYFFFSQEMNEETEDRLALERDLRKALIQQEFALFFQPQFNVRTGKIDAVEALVRWFHPVRGTVSPMRFIPIAEDTGLIIPLGDWILKEALRYLKRWDEMDLPQISVAVNLSAVQFQQEDLAGSIEKVLSDSGISPDRLELELTESVVMQDACKANNILSRLSGIGIKLAIDDFGTGYSSLSYLKRFAVDRLKIDQSFVRDMTHNYDDAEIAQAIINLGHTLGLEIVSEGVETKEQFNLLKKQGCDIIQGYYIGKPMPADNLETFLQEHPYF